MAGAVFSFGACVGVVMVVGACFGGCVEAGWVLGEGLVAEGEAGLVAAEDGAVTGLVD